MLKARYAKKEDIPQGFESLYTEKDGEFILTGIEGVKTESDIAAIKKALDSERDAHKQTRTQMKKLEDIEKKLAEMTSTKKDKEPAIDPKDDKSTDPNFLALKKSLEKQQEIIEQMQQRNKELELENKQKSILDQLKKTASGKIRNEAMGDLELYASMFDMTDDGDVVTKDGTKLSEWFETTLKNKPHWLPENQPGGATGGAGPGAGNLSIDDKKNQLAELTKKTDLTPQEMVQAHALASEIKKDSAA